MEIPGFEIERLIAEGGMASVYLAVQSSLNRQVAIKVLKKFDRPEQAQRFLEEGRIIASLNHHNIITIHDIGVVGDRYYIAMEYLEGGTLAERIAAGMPLDAVIDVMASIGDCLDFVHRRGIVHRDIKPANVLFHADGTPKLTDFGIAKQLDKNQGLTLDGTTLGSPHYLSPEQAGGRPLDGRSDLYSLGVVFYEMLTGQKPYAGNSSVETIIAHLTQPAPVLPGPAARFQDLLERLLAKNPDDRIASAREMCERLRELRPGPHPGRTRRGGAPRGHRSGSPVPLVIGSGLALLMLVASAVLFTRGRGFEPAPAGTAAGGENGPLGAPALPLAATDSRLPAEDGPRSEAAAMTATSGMAETAADAAAALSGTQAFEPETAMATADEAEEDPPAASPATAEPDGRAAAIAGVDAGQPEGSVAAAENRGGSTHARIGDIRPDAGLSPGDAAPSEGQVREPEGSADAAQEGDDPDLTTAADRSERPAAVARATDADSQVHSLGPPLYAGASAREQEGAAEEPVGQPSDESAGASAGGETATHQAEEDFLEQSPGPLLPAGESQPRAPATAAPGPSVEGPHGEQPTALDEADEVPIGPITSFEEGAAAASEDPATIDPFDGSGSGSGTSVPTPDTALEAPASQARAIEEWLAAADQALEKYHLTTPPGDNAYAYYQQILAIDPAHAAAQAGLDRIAGLYSVLARKELGQGDTSAAALYVRRGLDVQPGHAGLVALQAQVAKTAKAAQADKAKKAQSSKKRAPTTADRNLGGNIKGRLEKGLDRLRSLFD